MGLCRLIAPERFQVRGGWRIGGHAAPPRLMRRARRALRDIIPRRLLETLWWPFRRSSSKTLESNAFGLPQCTKYNAQGGWMGLQSPLTVRGWVAAQAPA